MGMLRRHAPDPRDSSQSLLGYLLGIAVVFVGAATLAYSLMKPVVVPNPGLAAYKSPPATRLVPLPPTTDGSELALLDDSFAESRAAPFEPPKMAAVAEPPKAPRANSARKPDRSAARPRASTRSQLAARRGQEQPAFAFAQDWNGRSRQPQPAWGLFW